MEYKRKNNGFLKDTILEIGNWVTKEDSYTMRNEMSNILER